MILQVEKKLSKKFIVETLGYYNPVYIEGRGWCALHNFLFTVGLVYGITEFEREGRYCYPHENAIDAHIAINTWDGVGHPSGGWVKHKGRKIEEINPEFCK